MEGRSLTLLTVGYTYVIVKMIVSLASGKKADNCIKKRRKCLNMIFTTFRVYFRSFCISFFLSQAQEKGC
jgi:hypothetical protein